MSIERRRPSASSHLLKADLATWTHSKVGALHGRIHRSVAGLALP
jgi:hypothetical protein